MIHKHIGFRSLSAFVVCIALGCLQPSGALLAAAQREVLHYTEAQRIFLHNAAESGNLAEVKHLVQAGVDINASTQDGITPLYIAAEEGHQQIIEYLVEAGADIDAATHFGDTPLHIAADEGHQEVVEYLVGAGADINASTRDGITPLYMAADKGHQEVVEYLVEAGANINAARQDGATPLFIAAQENHQEVVEYLVEAGANIDAATQSGATPLYIASLWGRQEVVESLVGAGANINAATQSGATPLFIAAHQGHRQIIEYLLETGANIAVAMQSGATPLHIAAQEGHQEVVEYLLRQGADLQATDRNGLTPLYLAALMGRRAMVAFLIENYDITLKQLLSLSSSAADVLAEICDREESEMIEVYMLEKLFAFPYDALLADGLHDRVPESLRISDQLFQRVKEYKQGHVWQHLPPEILAYIVRWLVAISIDGITVDDISISQASLLALFLTDRRSIPEIIAASGGVLTNKRAYKVLTKGDRSGVIVRWVLRRMMNNRSFPFQGRSRFIFTCKNHRLS